MENKYDDLVSENDQLRLMHRTAVVELESAKAEVARQAAKIDCVETDVEKGKALSEKMDTTLDSKTQEYNDLKSKLVKSEGSVKKLQAMLYDEKKKSGLYLKLKNDKDQHITLLVKEKNRLHDILQDMAKKHSQTSRQLLFAEKADRSRGPSTVEEESEADRPFADPDSSSPVDLDTVVNSPFENSRLTNTVLFPPSPAQSQSQLQSHLNENSRQDSILEAIKSIDSSNGSTRDRLLLNTIKKLSREMKRKEVEMREKDREFDRVKAKNDDLNRRIRNIGVSGGRKASRADIKERLNNATPLQQGRSPN